jgi:hypothetical protein
MEDVTTTASVTSVTTRSGSMHRSYGMGNQGSGVTLIRRGFRCGVLKVEE